MDIKQYHSVVALALKQALKQGLTNTDAIADVVIDRLDFVIEATMESDLVLVKTSPEPPAKTTPPAVVEKRTAVLSPEDKGVDVTRRFGSAPKEESTDVAPLDIHTKADIHKYLQQNTPLKLTVEIGDGDDRKTLELQRSLENSPDPMNFVRLSYRMAGQTNGADGAMYPIVVVNGSDQHLNAESYLKDIIREAQVLYRTREAAPIPTNFRPIASLSEGLPGSPSAETDMNAGSEDLSRWGSMSSNKFDGMTEAQARAMLNKR